MEHQLVSKKSRIRVKNQINDDWYYEWLVELGVWLLGVMTRRPEIVNLETSCGFENAKYSEFIEIIKLQRSFLNVE